MAEIRRFVGLWIPAELLEADELTAQEKLLAAEIDALDHPDTGCICKNEHFEGRLNVGPSRVKEVLARLSGMELIQINVLEGNRRSIRSRLDEWKMRRRASGSKQG